MTPISVVDHGAGNLVSIAQGLARAGARVTIASSPQELAGAGGVVLPGVGATGAAMRRLRASGLIEPLCNFPGPLLGICVGLQLLFDGSDEDPEPCLGLVPGRNRLLREVERLPHIGWNDLAARREDPLFRGIDPDATFYFVHSYAPDPEDPAVVTARCDHGGGFVAAVRSGRRTGVQFHPERSGSNGLRVLANFVEEVTRAA